MDDAPKNKWTAKSAVSLALAFTGSCVGVVVSSILDSPHTAVSVALRIVGVAVGCAGMVWATQVFRNARRAGQVLLILGVLWVAGAVAALIVRPEKLPLGLSGIVVGCVLAAAAALVLLGAACALLRESGSMPSASQGKRR